MRQLPRLLILSLFFFLTSVAAAEEVQIRYLGNEGFLITASGQKVLIDALYGEGIDGYPVVPRKIRKKAEEAKEDFALVDLVLASHYHGDHFDPGAVARHLEANERARFLSTRRATERVIAQNPALRPRVRAFWPEVGEKLDYVYGGIRVTAMRMYHGETPAQNLGWMIEIGGLKVIHLGDTEDTLKQMRPLELQSEEIDVALVPCWYFDTPRWQPALRALGARHRVAMHLAVPGAATYFFGPPGSYAKRVEAIRAFDEEVWIPREALEVRSFEGSATSTASTNSVEPAPAPSPDS